MQHRAAPDRRVGEPRLFYALYGSTPPTAILGETWQSARPRGRSGAARRRMRALIPGAENGVFHPRKSRQEILPISVQVGATMNLQKVVCCFCNQALRHTEAVVIDAYPNFKRIEAQSLFAHFSCFSKALHPEVPNFLEILGDEEPDDV